MIRKHLVAGLASAAVVAGLAAAGFVESAAAETRVTYKSAKSTSSYYQMAVQIAEAMKAGSGGEIIVTVEESQGSVQNVKEAVNRSGNYVFTTPPGLVRMALNGERMFEPKDPAYEEIRSLFVIPSLTMHYVVRADTGVDDIAGLVGKSFIIGKGSFGAREAAKNFELFGLKDKINLIEAELNDAVPALKNGQVDGFATAGSYPAPNVMEAAAGTRITLLSMTAAQLAATERTRLVIPAGTYPGVDYEVTTTSLPVGAYTTTAMDEETAYQLTKTFWDGKPKMGAANPWWNGVNPEMLSTLGAALHPGALKYYEEAGIEIPENLM